MARRPATAATPTNTSRLSAIKIFFIDIGREYQKVGRSLNYSWKIQIFVRAQGGLTPQGVSVVQGELSYLVPGGRGVGIGTSFLGRI